MTTEIPLRHGRELDVIEIVGKRKGSGLQRPGQEEQAVLPAQPRARGRDSKRDAQMTETGSIVAINSTRRLAGDESVIRRPRAGAFGLNGKRHQRIIQQSGEGIALPASLFQIARLAREQQRPS